MSEDQGQAMFLMPRPATRSQRAAAVRDGYPEEWPQVATRLKAAAGGRCEVCGHVAGCDDQCHHTGAPRHRALTVHHLDMDKTNLDRDNLVVACQVCHLVIQGRQKWPEIVYQEPLLRLPEWMLWRVEARRIQMGVPTQGLYRAAPISEAMSGGSE